MRMMRTGTGRGQLLGTATVIFYASTGRTIDSCSVYWDSDPSYAAVLPALALDEWLPNLRSITVQTDSGLGELRGKDAQAMVLGQLGDWLIDADEQLATGGVPVFDALPLVAENDKNVVARADVSVRVNHRKRRLWAEVDIEPDDAEQVVFGAVRKVLWDWAIRSSSLPVKPEELVVQMRRQCQHYEQHGIPSSFHAARDWHGALRGLDRAPGDRASVTTSRCSSPRTWRIAVASSRA